MSSVTLPVPAAQAVYRRWCANPGDAGEWVAVAEPVACEFHGFEGALFVSHRWWGERYSVFEATTGFGVDGLLDPNQGYPTRGQALDAAEAELRRITPEAFRAAVADVFRARGGQG